MRAKMKTFEIRRNLAKGAKKGQRKEIRRNLAE